MLKSSSKLYSSKTQLLQRGRDVEARAAKYLTSLGYRIVFRNIKIWGVEHDLVVVNSADELIFVEVKSLAHIKDLQWRVKPEQKNRLRRSAQAYVAAKGLKSQGVWLLAMESNGCTHFYPLD